MSLADAVRQAFPNCEFGPPVPPAEIAAAEQALGHPLPPALRDLYAAFDGFKDATNAHLLMPLTRRPHPRQESLLTFTEFLRGEIPDLPWLQTAVAAGHGGTGPAWFVSIEHPDQVWWWDAAWGDDYELEEGALLDVWLRWKAANGA